MESEYRRMSGLHTFKISTIITAGGVSSRFGSNKLLEEIQIDGKKISVILASIEKFVPYSSEIIVPCRNDVREHIENRATSELCAKIKFADFGKTRQESVFKGLLKCNENPPAVVLIHDGARPFIERDTIEKAIEKLKIYKGVCVGVFAVDTIKITDSEGIITHTIDRNAVFQAQTPQCFDFKTIFEAHLKLKGENFTDDSSLLEHFGVDVYALKASAANKKITFREDLV